MNKNRAPVLWLVLMLLGTYVQAQETDQILHQVNSLQRIAGCSVGKEAKQSEEYLLFEAIEKLSTYDIVVLFEKTNNYIGKVLCYWALKERKYANRSIYREYLIINYFGMLIETHWYGNLVEKQPLTKMLDYDFRKYWSGKL